MRGTVLVADDHARARRAFARELAAAGFDVCEAEDGAQAWERFQGRRPDVVVTDLKMPRGDGIDLLTRIREVSEVPVIVFSSHATPQAATAAMKGGALDFACAHDVEIEDLVNLVANAMASSTPPAAPGPLSERLIGTSRPMERTRERLSALAPLRTPVLIAGEPGSGRDTAARALHELGSSRGDELQRITPDAPRLAASRIVPSAVYLDGIESFDATAHAYWAERLEAAEHQGFKQRPRVFASTATPLRSLGADPAFAAGVGRLLLRFALELPPLRSLADDVPAIAQALSRRVGASIGRTTRLSPAACNFLREQRWTGNVTQLERVIERAITYSRGRYVRRETVEEVFEELSETLDTIRQRGTQRERRALLEALELTGGNVTLAAERLGRSRAAVYRLIEKHGIPLRRSR